MSPDHAFLSSVRMNCGADAKSALRRPRAHVEKRFPTVSSPPMTSPPMVSETVTVKVAVSHDPYPIQPRKRSVVSVDSDKSL